MRNIKNTILSLLLIVTTASFAQQMAQYSQYNFNHYLLNPAIGGLSKYLEAQVGARAQWVGFDGAPNTVFASVHLPLDYPIGNIHIKEKPHQGVGGYVFKDQAGAISWSGAYVSYSYHFKISKKSRLALGTFLGAKQYALDGSKVKFTQSDFDPKITGGRETQFVPDGSIGLWYHNDKVFAGISINQIFNNKIDIAQIAAENNFGKMDNHFYMHLGYIYTIDKHLKLVPSMLLKAVSPAPLQADVSLKAVIDKQYWFGASLRNLDAFVIFAGFIHGNFEMGYAFDLTFNNMQKHSAGSHEIIVGLLLPRFENGVVCPSRYW